MISFEHKFIFIHAPKTGGESIQKTLGKYAASGRAGYFVARDGELIDESQATEGYILGPEPFANGKAGKHIRLFQYIDGWKQEYGDFKDYFKFGVARNPWDRMVSWLLHRQQKASLKIRNRWANASGGIEGQRRLLKKFLCKARPDLATFFNDKSNNIGLDYVIRFEDFNAGFAEVCDGIGVPREVPAHIHKTERLPYWEYYTNRTRGMIARRYARDIAIFGYKFGL